MTQKEFDAEMIRINGLQMTEKKVYQNLINENNRQKRDYLLQIQMYQKDINALKDKNEEYFREIKNINIKYHAMKHQLCVENPKNSMVDEVTD